MPCLYSASSNDSGNSRDIGCTAVLFGSFGRTDSFTVSCDSYHTYEAAPGDLEKHPSCLLGRQPRCEARIYQLLLMEPYKSVIPTSILLHAHTIREIRIISSTSPQPHALFHLLPKPKESSHTFLVIFGFLLIMFHHQGKRAFPGTHTDQILPRLHVPFFFFATLTVVARFASKYRRNAKWALDDWLIMTGLVTSPSNHSQAAADALSCSSTVKELALFRVGPSILYSIYR